MNGDQGTGAGVANVTGGSGASAGTQEARRAAVARLTNATARRQSVGNLSAATARLILRAHVHTNGQLQAASASTGSAPELPRILITSTDGTSIWATDAPGGGGPSGSNGTRA